MIYKLIIDEATLEKYNEHYFKMYPKRRVPPIDSVQHVSLNKWSIMLRPQCNELKQKYKEFIVWLVESYGYTNLGIDKCIISYHYYFKDKRKRDYDNYVPKFYQDGLTESKMLIEDNYTVVQELRMKIGYDKEHPRTEIIIETI